MNVSFASGNTTPGQTDWRQDGPSRIYVDIMTGANRFSSTPVYVVSLGGSGPTHETIGGNVVGKATKTGFRVSVEWADGHPLTTEEANSNHWHVLWMAGK